MWWWVCSGGLLWAQAQMATLPCAPGLIAVDEIGHVYAWCGAEKALLKVWAPAYDSVTRIGGGPGAKEGFFEVTALVPVGNQQLYVLDVGRQALFLLGTNLQVLRKVPFEEMALEIARGFPTWLTAMPGGDLFMGLRETQEVVRIDAFGRILVRFGGKVSGPAMLVRIQGLRAADNLLLVMDEGGHLKVFDSWGMLVDSWQLPSRVISYWAVGPGSLLWQEKGEWSYIPDILQPSQRRQVKGLGPEVPAAAYLMRNRFYFTVGRALYEYRLP